MRDAITIRAEACDCAPGQCAHFVEPDTDCVSRLSGDVVTKNCRTCNPTGNGATWHQDGECLRCRSTGCAAGAGGGAGDA